MQIRHVGECHILYLTTYSIVAYFQNYNLNNDYNIMYKQENKSNILFTKLKLLIFTF